MNLPRRDIKTRNRVWAQNLARFIAEKTSITPNGISVLSIFWAFIAMCGYCLYFNPVVATKYNFVIPIVIIFGIQLRLLCNLLDGMVAIEGGKHSVIGGIYNEFPDRISDTFILVGAGIAGMSNLSVILGLVAALLAALTAYTRLLGGTIGTDQYFVGPMAKQHRMALLTIVALSMFFQPLVSFQMNTTIYPICLGVIIIGCIATVCNRLWRIKKELETK